MCLFFHRRSECEFLINKSIVNFSHHFLFDVTDQASSIIRSINLKCSCYSWSLLSIWSKSSFNLLIVSVCCKKRKPSEPNPDFAALQVYYWKITRNEFCRRKPSQDWRFFNLFWSRGFWQITFIKVQFEAFQTCSNSQYFDCKCVNYLDLTSIQIQSHNRWTSKANTALV